MQKHSNKQAYIFILILSAIAAVILASASQFLKNRIELNMEKDVMKNILTAFELSQKPECAKDILSCYKKYVKSYVVDANGKKATSKIDHKKIDITREITKKKQDQRFPVFVKMKDNKIYAYCFPIIGKGLWSTLYGYVALEKDINTILGITFYKHAETPGLGAEIEKDWFRKNFKGKQIYDAKGKLVSIKVIKGQVTDKTEDKIHKVDGISGATITADGVTKLLKKSLSLYKPYFKYLKEERK